MSSKQKPRSNLEILFLSFPPGRSLTRSISFSPKTYPKPTCSLHPYLCNSSTIILCLLSCNPSESGLSASNLMTHSLQHPPSPSATEQSKYLFKTCIRDFPGGPAVKNLPAMQGTRVLSLVWEDSTCCGATKPEGHSYWAWAPWRLCSTTRGAPVVRSPGTTKTRSPCSPQLGKARGQHQDPGQPKITN